MFKLEDIKVVLPIFLIMLVVFTAIMLHRAEHVDVAQNEYYSEIHEEDE